MKIFLFTTLATCILLLIGFIFWQQEYKFSLPTPIPINHILLSKGDSVNLPDNLLKQGANYFHFYNYNCPCSRFNIKEFQSIVKKYENDINFYAVLQTTDTNKEAINEFKAKYDLGIKVLDDPNGEIAKSLGVYSTPQVVIVKDQKIFYKGNYNKARFCLSKNTKFAEMALTALMKNEEPPMFPSVAEIAYGCELPSNGGGTAGFLSIFN
jgi:peroxiredoxin